MYRNGLFHKLVVGNVPLNLSKLFFKFLQVPNSIVICKVTGKRVNRDVDYGLQLPNTRTCTVLEKIVAWIERKIVKR